MFFVTSPLTPAENCSEPPAILLSCPLRSVADYRCYIDPLTWEFSHRMQNFNPFYRIPLSTGVSGLVKKKHNCTVTTKSINFIVHVHIRVNFFYTRTNRRKTERRQNKSQTIYRENRAILRFRRRRFKTRRRLGIFWENSKNRKESTSKKW